MSTQPTALRLADALEENADLDSAEGGNPAVCKLEWDAAAELRRLHEENQRLKTVMIAAAEELSKHWEAHCDAEGYGPVNLMRRLEKGIASEYSYTAGSFARLHEVNQELLEMLKAFSDYVRDEQNSTDGAVTYSTTAINHWAFLARAAIAKATGEQT